MRKPEEIPGLEQVQITAYYKSFLHKLDNSKEKLTDWEADFVGSTMYKTSEYTEKQIAVIQRLMDKFPKQTPTFKHYSEVGPANAFVANLVS